MIFIGIIHSNHPYVVNTVGLNINFWLVGTYHIQRHFSGFY